MIDSVEHHWRIATDNVPTDWSATIDLTTTPGSALLTASGTTPLDGDAQEIFRLTGMVPYSAEYGEMRLLEIGQLSVNSGSIAAIGDRAVQCIALPGDTTGNGAYSGLDAQRISRVMVMLQSGFDAFPMTEPLIIGDASGDNRLNSFDASTVAQAAVNLPVPQVPALPAPEPLAPPAALTLGEAPTIETPVEMQEATAETTPVTTPQPIPMIAPQQAPVVQETTLEAALADSGTTASSEVPDTSIATEEAAAPAVALGGVIDVTEEMVVTPTSPEAKPTDSFFESVADETDLPETMTDDSADDASSALAVEIAMVRKDETEEDADEPVAMSEEDLDWATDKKADASLVDSLFDDIGQAELDDDSDWLL